MKDVERDKIVDTIQDIDAMMTDAFNIKDALDKDIAAKKREVEKLQEGKDALERDVKELGKIKDTSQLLSTKDQEISFLKEKIKDLEAEKSTLVSSEKGLALSLDAAKESLGQIEASKHDLWKKVQLFQEELDKMFDLRERFEISENERNVINKKLSFVETELQSAATENNSLKMNMGLVRQSEEDLRRAKKELEEEYKDLENSTRREREELTRLKQEKRVMLEKMTSLQSQLDLSAMTRDKIGSEISLTKEAFESLSRERDRLKEKLLEMEEKARPDQESEAKFQARINDLEAEKERLLRNINTLEDEVASEEVSRIKKEAELVNTKKVFDDLRSNYSELSSRLDKMTKKALEAKELENKAAKLGQERNDALDYNRTLQAAKDAAEDALNTSRKALEDAIEGKERLEMRFAPLAEEEGLLRDMEEKLARSEDDKNEALEKIKALEERLSNTMVMAKDEAEQLKETKDTRISEALEEIGSLKKENARLKKDTEFLSKDRKKGLEGLEYIKESLAESEEAKEGLEARLEGKKSMSKALDEALKEIDSLKKENARLKKDTEFLSKDSKKGLEGLEYIKESLAESEEAKKGLEAKLEARESMTKALDEALKETETLKMENAKLKKDMESLVKDSGKGFEGLSYIQKSLMESEKARKGLEARLEGKKSMSMALDEALKEISALNKEKARLKKETELLSTDKKGFEGLEFIRKSLVESEEARKGLEAKIEGKESMSKALDQALKEADSLKKEGKETKEALEESEKARTALKKRIEELEESVEELKKAPKKIDIDKEKKDSAELKKLKEKAGKFEEIEAALQKMEKEKLSIKQELDKFQKEAGAAAKEKEISLESEIAALTKENKNFKKRLAEAADADDLRKIQEKLNTAESDKDELIAKLDEAEEKIEELEEKIEELS